MFASWLTWSGVWSPLAPQLILSVVGITTVILLSFSFTCLRWIEILVLTPSMWNFVNWNRFPNDRSVHLALMASGHHLPSGRSWLDEKWEVAHRSFTIDKGGFVNQNGWPDLQMLHLALMAVGYQLPSGTGMLEGYSKIAHRSSCMPPKPSSARVPTPIISGFSRQYRMNSPVW